ncbi:chlorophyll synthase [Rhodobium orientis]|uniref:Bacteriochlorophyll/chlorophyll a synthase n=1 Tax=Rhodobium orientis TaxID=34017 RepID=A0A327JPZ7_9HYPH|nr:chlorophyll synthase ChlG [Rhodobium orientis]MBB4303332.1 chlorophyll synthase [Rhodobium orientis]MBK5951573.1 bacteriochlorophyll/chlorophyll a synthase [Rhodobium orientis]RAI27785.1 bacteriochlorophyll/chlorophyll a synthase [Rhodobium orientis]
MDAYRVSQDLPRVPTVGATIQLLKPITWFPPMWAYACGVVSAGAFTAERWWFVIGGILLAGPLLCGTSQAVNDWFDRHVDAINEPDRVIPSGRMPGRWGLYVAIIASALSMVVAALLGAAVFWAALIGLALAWAYSAPPFRLKQNGWFGNAAVGFSYESLPWFTAAAAALGGLPPAEIIAVALLYGVGAHGIMTLNDFKSVEGDTQHGLASLPVQLGVSNAARFACLVMGGSQAAVIALLIIWQHFWAAGVVGLVLAIQIGCMMHMLKSPKERAVWYSAIGVGLYVSGMMATAISLRTLTVA